MDRGTFPSKFLSVPVGSILGGEQRSLLRLGRWLFLTVQGHREVPVPSSDRWSCLIEECSPEAQTGSRQAETIARDSKITSRPIGAQLSAQSAMLETTGKCN